jgi:hypothetical protein
MMADRVSLSGPLRNCVRAPHWRDALDSRPLIGHPACGLEVSDFDTPEASLLSGSELRYQFQHRPSAKPKATLKIVTPRRCIDKTEEEAHETS